MNRVPQSTGLLDVAKQAHLFRTPEGEAYAALPNGTTAQIGAQAVRAWLTLAYIREKGSPPNKQAIEETLNVLEAQALYESPTESVFLRVGWVDDQSLFLDLGDKIAEIDGEGWRILPGASPVRFIRPNGFLPLPEPKRGGSLADLRPFVQVSSEQDWVLIVSWLLGALNPTGPYPLLALHGERGSGKSYLTRCLRALIDPATSDTTRPPKDAEALTLKARCNWVVAIDNVSSLSMTMSDDFCRLATGHGDSTRRLYTNTDQVLFKAKRPVILNGIPDFAKQGDLLDRLIPITLPVMDPSKRQPETVLDKQFEEARPYILGALLDAVAAALAGRDSVTLEDLPRMADFAVWVMAAEKALDWTAGTFKAAYADKQAEAVDIELEASPVGSVVMRFMGDKMTWSGQPSELYAALEDMLTPMAYGRRQEVAGWPKSASAFSAALKRVAPALRTRGLDVERGHSTDRSITITRTTPITRQQFEEIASTKHGLTMRQAKSLLKLDTLDGQDYDALLEQLDDDDVESVL